MQSASIRKWLLALVLLAVILWTIVHFYNLSAQKAGNVTRIILEPQGEFAYRKTNIPAATPPKAAARADVQQSPRQKVESWLTMHHRSAASLLAAFHVLDDTNYLKEAAATFPNDPRVESAVLMRNVFPEDRRKWLDLFKASSPSNSLADYLSAQAFFQSGQSEAAVKDLVAATAKPDFENYTVESQLDAEELALFAGKSPLDAAETGVASYTGDTLPELATLRQLASQMSDLQKQELNVSDNNSAENLAQMGMMLGEQLNSGANGKFMLNQLAGITIESLVLAQMQPNTAYDFLDEETPSQKLQELGQEHAELNRFSNSLAAILPTMTDAESVSFMHRKIIYGDAAAIRWLVKQHSIPAAGQ